MHGTIPQGAPAWFPDWSGQVSAIVAGGESVKAEDVAKLQGRCRVIVINNSFELAPWADLLYAADAKWWDHHPAASKFAGLKVTTEEPAAKRYGLHLIDLLGKSDEDRDRIVVDQPGKIARGGNSGFQAINLATQFGSTRQIWMGFDLTGKHWHADHPTPLKNPSPRTFEKWAKRFEAQGPVLSALGVDVINASELSVLTAYPKMSVMDALAHWGI